MTPEAASNEAVKALAKLVHLKDGPRDAEYERCKGAAWDTARLIVQGKYRYAIPEAASNTHLHQCKGADDGRLECIDCGLVYGLSVSEHAILDDCAASAPPAKAETLDGDWDWKHNGRGKHFFYRIANQHVNCIAYPGFSRPINERGCDYELACYYILSGEWTRIDSPPAAEPQTAEQPAPRCVCGGMLLEWEGHNVPDSRCLRCTKCGDKKPLGWKTPEQCFAASPPVVPAGVPTAAEIAVAAMEKCKWVNPHNQTEKAYCRDAGIDECIAIVRRFASGELVPAVADRGEGTRP